MLQTRSRPPTSSCSCFLNWTPLGRRPSRAPLKRIRLSILVAPHRLLITHYHTPSLPPLSSRWFLQSRLRVEVQRDCAGDVQFFVYGKRGRGSNGLYRVQISSERFCWGFYIKKPNSSPP